MLFKSLIQQPLIFPSFVCTNLIIDSAWIIAEISTVTIPCASMLIFSCVLYKRHTFEFARASAGHQTNSNRELTWAKMFLSRRAVVVIDYATATRKGVYIQVLSFSSACIRRCFSFNISHPIGTSFD